MKLDSTDVLRFLIFFPTRTSQITAHYAFDRERRRFLYDHRASNELFPKRMQFLGKRFEIRRNKMILDVVKMVEPKLRNLVEDCALVRNWIGQDHVESRDAVRCDEEQRLSEIKNFAHLAAAQFFDSWKVDRGLCGGLHMRSD